MKGEEFLTVEVTKMKEVGHYEVISAAGGWDKGLVLRRKLRFLNETLMNVLKEGEWIVLLRGRSDESILDTGSV